MRDDILWIGEGDYWRSPPPPRDPKFCMPLIEETVLQAALISERSSMRGLSVEAALRCTSRLRLRQSLPPALSPEHIFVRAENVVTKGPWSTMGVNIILPDPPPFGHLDPESSKWIIQEEVVPGPQYEIDGMVVGGGMEVFGEFIQHWDEGEITEYEPYDAGLTNTAREVIMALGLRDCPFCFEMRWHGRWVVIDAHARLGEDYLITPLLWENVYGEHSSG